MTENLIDKIRQKAEKKEIFETISQPRQSCQKDGVYIEVTRGRYKGFVRVEEFANNLPKISLMSVYDLKKNELIYWWQDNLRIKNLSKKTREKLGDVELPQNYFKNKDLTNFIKDLRKFSTSF